MGKSALAEEWVHLVEIVEQLQDGEDAGSDEKTHLTPDVTCREDTEPCSGRRTDSHNSLKQLQVQCVSVALIYDF